MKIDHQIASLYVGGGITADSNPELEWEETVKKSMTLSSIFE
jgi:isochorismate synthase